METLDTIDPMQEKSEHNLRTLPFTKLWIFQIWALSLSSSKIRTFLNWFAYSWFYSKQEFERLLQNSNWTLLRCVKAGWFANRQIETRIVIVKQVYGGGGTWVNFCWVCAARASQNPHLIIVYSAASYRPHLSHFWTNG